jgi:hypothetical protein
MSDIESVPYGQQDLPESGPCPCCERVGARYGEVVHPETEKYKIRCHSCGEYVLPKGELVDYLDSL